MAALIISKTKPVIVRRLFGDDSSVQGTNDEATAHKSHGTGNSIEMSSVENTGSSNNENTELEPKKTGENFERKFYKEENDLDMFDIKTDLIDRDFTLSLAAVLDSLAEQNDNGLYTVHVKLLAEDDRGQEPGNEDFQPKDHTVFQTIAAKSREMSNHPVMQLLIEHKWTSWCRKQFAQNVCLYLLSLFAFTFSIAVGASASSVTVYDSRLQHARTVFEVVTYIFALHTFFIEVRQMCRHALNYWKQFFNWLELAASFLILLALPLRYTLEHAHWFILAVAYLLWVMRIFKYATVFSQTGAYAESLFRIPTGDFTQFSLLFLVINLAFGGTFLMILKGEDSLQTHDESSSYWDIWFLGLRIMVESAPIVEYVGPSGYRTTGSIVFTVFTFVTIVVLMNILIAQLSNTYTDIQVAAVKTARANRAWIITRAERNEWKCCRKQSRRERYYRRVYTDIDMRRLQAKDETELDAISKAVTHIEKKQVKDALQTLTVKFRLGKFTDDIIKLIKSSHLSLKEHADSTGADIKSRVTQLESKVDKIDNKIDTVTQQLIEMRKLFDALLEKNSELE